MLKQITGIRLLSAIALIFAIVLALHLKREGFIDYELILNFIEKHSLAAPLLFIIIYAIFPSLFLPTLPFAFMAGLIWGTLPGIIFAITGATIGASVAFLLSRYILKDTVKQKLLRSKWHWLVADVEKHGWKVVAFARLVPGSPYPVVNYLFGATPIPFLHYLWSTFVFMLPTRIIYVVIGNSAGDIILKENIKGLIAGIIAISAMLILISIITPALRKKLLKEASHCRDSRASEK
jgi:uncharacterized membrane protein YdjX (TVP38/TMEM64 family)